MADDIARRLRQIQASGYYRANTLRINLTEQGGLTLSPVVGETGREFSTLAQAEAYIRDFGLTSSERVQPSRGFLGGSSATQNIARQFEAGVNLSDVSVLPGGYVEEQHFRFDDPSQLESFRQVYNPEPGRYMGFANIDENKATLLRFFDPSGQELEQYQAEEVVYQTRGLQENIAEPGGKLGKRVKGMLTQRMFEMEDTQPIRVGIIDAQSDLDMGEFRGVVSPQIEQSMRNEFGLADDFDSPGFRALLENRIDDAEATARQRAVEGFSEISERGARKVQGFIEQQAQEFELQRQRVETRMADATPGQYYSLLRQQEDLAQSERLLKQRAGEMASFIENRSGTFNMRALGLELENIHGVDISHLWSEDGRMEGVFELKGNAVISDNPYMSSENVDIITDVSNLKREAGFAPGSGGRLTLNPFTTPSAPMEPTRWDIQTASSMPDLIDSATIQQMKEQVRMDIDAMAERVSRGEVPDEMVDMLRAQAGAFDPTVAREAQHALGYIERGGSLADDPDLARRILRTYHGEDVRLQRAVGQKLAQKGLDDTPIYQMPLPDTFRGEITPRFAMQNVVPEEDLPEPGQLRYSKRYQAWIMHESDAGLRYFAGGGFDFDDMMNNMIRYNPNADTLEESIEGLVYRQPNVRSEWMRLRSDPSDYALQHILEREGVAERFEGMFQARERSRARLQQAQTAAEEAEYAARVRRAETSLHRLLEQNLRHVPEGVDDIPMRYGERIYEGTTEAGENIYRYEGEPFANYIEPTKESPQYGAVRPWEMTPESRWQHGQRVIDVLRNFVGGEGALVGTYSNARMFRDHWIANQQTALGGNPNLLNRITQNLYEHEDVIDAYAQGFARQPTTDDVTQASHEMVKSIYRGATYLRAQGFDIDEVGVDPVLQRWKDQFSQAAREGIEQGIADLDADQVQYDPQNIPQSVDDLMMSEDSPRATISQFYRASVESDEYAKQIERSIGNPSWINDVPGLESERTTADARRLLDATRRADELYQEFMDSALDGSQRVDEAVRASQAEMMTDVVDMFEQGQAGPRANEAVLRARQLAEQEGIPQSVMDRMLRRLRGVGWTSEEIDEATGRAQRVSLGLSEQAIKHGRFQAGVDAANALDELPPITSMDVYHDIGMVTRGGPGVDEAVGRILTEQASEETPRPSWKALDDLTAGIEIASRRNRIDLSTAPENVQRLFQGDPSTARAIHEGGMRGPLSPDLPIDVPLPERDPFTGSQRAVRTLGDMLYESMSAREAGRETQIVDKHIADALTDYYESMRQWGQTPGLDAFEAMPTEVRSYMERSIEGGDIFPASDYGRRAAQQASDDATRATDVSGGRYQRVSRNLLEEMASTRAGRLGGYGLLAAGALVLYRRGNRDPDFTEQHMQGPSTLNREPAPYSSLDRYLAARNRPDTQMDPNVRGPGKNEGTTIEVDTNESLSDDVLEALSQTVGGTVTARERSPSIRTQLQAREDRLNSALGSY